MAANSQDSRRRFRMMTWSQNGENPSHLGESGTTSTPPSFLDSLFFLFPEKILVQRLHNAGTSRVVSRRQHRYSLAQNPYQTDRPNDGQFVEYDSFVVVGNHCQHATENGSARTSKRQPAIQSSKTTMSQWINNSSSSRRINNRRFIFEYFCLFRSLRLDENSIIERSMVGQNGPVYDKHFLSIPLNHQFSFQSFRTAHCCSKTDAIFFFVIWYFHFPPFEVINYDDESKLAFNGSIRQCVENRFSCKTQWPARLPEKISEAFGNCHRLTSSLNQLFRLNESLNWLALFAS